MHHSVTSPNTWKFRTVLQHRPKVATLFINVHYFTSVNSFLYICKHVASENTFMHIKRDRFVFEPIPSAFVCRFRHIRCRALRYVPYSKLYPLSILHMAFATRYKRHCGC